MTQLLAAAVALGVLLPLVRPLERASPAVAATAWCAALTIRAVTVIYVVLYLALFLPHRGLLRSPTTD